MLALRVNAGTLTTKSRPKAVSLWPGRRCRADSGALSIRLELWRRDFRAHVASVLSNIFLIIVSWLMVAPVSRSANGLIACGARAKDRWLI